MELFQQFAKTVPVETLTLAAPVQPFEDDMTCLMVESTQHVDIAGYAIIVEMTEQFCTKAVHYVHYI